jgi:hypothetical protein
VYRRRIALEGTALRRIYGWLMHWCHLRVQCKQSCIIPWVLLCDLFIAPVISWCLFYSDPPARVCIMAIVFVPIVKAIKMQ